MLFDTFFKMGHSRPLFLYFHLFNTVDSKCSINIFADDWIRTADLWNWKQLLYQLRRHHFPLIHFYVLNALYLNILARVIPVLFP